MAYIDYLPTSATICEVALTTKTDTKAPNVSRKSYSRGILGGYACDIFVDVNNTGSNSFVNTLEEGDFNQYGMDDSQQPVTYSQGDVVNLSSLGLKFKFSGATDITISSYEDEVLYHPSKVNYLGERENADIWIPIGVSDGDQFFDVYSGKYTSNIFSGWSDMKLSYHGGETGLTTDFCIFILGIKAEVISVVIYDNELGGTISEQFNFFASTKDRFYMKLPINFWSTVTKPFEITFVGKTHDLIREQASFDTVCFCKETPIGSSLYGHTQSRVSEFKTVISDNMQKSMIVKSYDTFNGHIVVDQEKLQESEFELAKATQGDYVFHTGTGQEIYDQRVYLGKIKYSSLIENNSKYKINISGQSLSYNVENPLIAPDSTDGYPV